MSQFEKIAMVTGAGTGIGRATASKLLAAGYAVVLVGRRQAPLVESISLARQAHTEIADDQALAAPCDVTDPDQVAALFARLKASYGRLDVLFNNAGMGLPPLTVGEMTFQQWKSVVDVNLNGVFNCAHEAFNLMKDQQPQGGRIINNGSISAYAPRPGSAPYTATKHAITGLTKSISLDGRPFDIACGQIDIGNAATPMTAQFDKGIPQAHGAIVPEPTMDVAHVADAVLYMAQLPLNANVQNMTVMATKMPFVGRG
jgi:NAD(P)-dependent dehydrogenase (short-subunit alcohol dehydrogenase family)|tara:strand:+ start:31 stop:804 length:774 start_codon:yes stop_codon:yes gene_type:complete